MCCKCMNLICICKRQKINCNKKQIILYVLHSSSYNINYTHKDITLAIIARGISQYNHLSRRSIASQAGAGRNPSDTGRRPAQAICPAYRFSFSSTVFIRSSVNPNREANFLKACILLLGIREYRLLIGVSLFNALLICCFFIILS